MRKKKINQIKWIIYVTSIAVCLIGVSYAAYTDYLVVNSKITSARMNYSFSFDGKNLNVTLGSNAASHLLSMGQGDRYVIDYTIKNDDYENIPLKNVSNNYIGSIDIQLKSAGFGYNDNSLGSYSYLLTMLPSSLGTFDCFHDFDGTNGSISLIKVSPPQVIETVISKSSLPIDILQQLDLVSNESKEESKSDENNELVEDAISSRDIADLTEIPSEIAQDDITEESKGISYVSDVQESEESNSEDNSIEEKKSKENRSEGTNAEGKSSEEKDSEKNDSEKKDSRDNQELDQDVIYKKEKVIVMSIGIEGTYEFMIPLVYDQFNN